MASSSWLSCSMVHMQEKQMEIELVPVAGNNPPASDSKAEQELIKHVAANRQHLPPLPKRPQFVDALPVPEDELLRAERETRESQRAEIRRKDEIRHRFNALLLAAGARYRDCTLDNFVCREQQQTK